MDIETRIAQFEQLTKDDPKNDMAFFSLGGAYNQAGRYDDAAAAYRQCIAINDGFSKAYQLAGAALMAAQKPDEAGEVLQEGYRVAASKGDLMPKKAIGELLDQLGVERPEVQEKPQEAVTGSFICGRTGKPGTQMTRPPFRGPIGEWIQTNISKQTFDDWIALGTKVINELKLDLSRDEHEVVYDYGMRRYLGITDELHEKLTGKPGPVPDHDYKDMIDTIISRMGDLESFGGKMHEQVN